MRVALVRSGYCPILSSPLPTYLVHNTCTLIAVFVTITFFFFFCTGIRTVLSVHYTTVPQSRILASSTLGQSVDS